MYNFNNIQQRNGFNQMKDGNPTQLVEPMYHDFASNGVPTGMGNHRCDGVTPVMPNPGGILSGSGMTTLPVYTIPEDVIKTLIDQNKKITGYEEQCRSLATAVEVAQKEATYAKAAVEMLKTKPPFAGRSVYLAEDSEGRGTLELVKKEPNRCQEARLPVSDATLKDACFVEGRDGENYIFLRFVKANTDILFHIPEVQYQNNRQLMHILAQQNIILNVETTVGKKMNLMREYAARVSNGRIVRESDISWSRKENRWCYTSKDLLPIWDRRKTFPVLMKNPYKQMETAMENLKKIFLGDSEEPQKILRMLPFAAEFIPLFEAYGCSGSTMINVVFHEWHPLDIHRLTEIMGVSHIHTLPMGTKELKAVVETDEKVILVRIDSVEVSMQERNLLLQNLRSLKTSYCKQKIVLICSEAPVLLWSEEICELSFEMGIAKSFCKYLTIKDAFQTYLTRNANQIAQMIRVNKIPREMGEFGTLYEILRVTSDVIQQFCEEYYEEEIPRDNRDWIKDYFQAQARNKDLEGLAMQFLDCLKEAVNNGLLTVITPYDPWSEQAVIVTDEEVYFRKETLDIMLTKNLRAYNERCILRNLYDEGYLIAENGKKMSFKTRRRLTNKDFAPMYEKCIVLRRNNIVRCGDVDVFDF